MTPFNHALFQHRDVASNELNNLCTIIHRLPEDGIYFGEVYSGKNLLNNFRIVRTKDREETQVNIDLSKLDSLHLINQRIKNDIITEFQVGQEGYLIFYASAHHNNLSIRLYQADKTKSKVVFDSRKLSDGDIVVFRLWHPGSYSITNTIGNGKLSLKVKQADDGKYIHPSKLEPIRVVVNDKGFSGTRVEKSPVQALMFECKTACALSLKAEKLAEETSKKKKSVKK